MAGHSKFKNIQFRKGAQDKKRSKLFSKLGREITAAAKMGMPDPTMNPRLRTAVAAARAVNMPKDNIERAIKKSQEAGGANYEEMRYEGFGAGGVGVIVEALTDNRNRTASEVRSIFTKFGGNLGETGAVSFNFDRLGAIEFDAAKATADQMLEAAIEAGADDCEFERRRPRRLLQSGPAASGGQGARGEIRRAAQRADHVAAEDRGADRRGDRAEAAAHDRRARRIRRRAAGLRQFRRGGGCAAPADGSLSEAEAMKPPRQSKSTEYKHLREQAALPGRGGIARIWAALWNTVGGLREGLGTEAAIKQEVAIALIALPLSFFVATNLWIWVALDRQSVVSSRGRVPQHRHRAAVQSRPARVAHGHQGDQGSRLGGGVLRHSARRADLDRGASRPLRVLTALVNRSVTR